MTQIQKHTWQTKKLSSICSIKTGKKDVNQGNPNGKYPFFTCARECTYSDEFSFDTEALLIAGNGDVGHVQYYKGKFEAYQRTYILHDFSTDISVQYLFHYLVGFLKDTVSRQKLGNTMPYIKLGMIANFEIPLPPLPEQLRIVSILDQAFDLLDQARKNAETNLQNVKEVFESYLQNVFANPGDDWEEKRFDEICILQRGFDLPTHSRNEGEFPLVSSNGITDRIDLWRVKAPGVVTGRSGTIGNVHFVVEDFWPLNTALYIKEFHGNHERFIYFFLKQFDLGRFSSGAGVPTLNRNNVHGETVWFPKSLPEQLSIVSQLDTISTETKRLESIYQHKLACLDELRKSLLKKAFNGEL